MFKNSYTGLPASLADTDGEAVRAPKAVDATSLEGTGGGGVKPVQSDFSLI